MKNGKIELYRFIFSIILLIFHINQHIFEFNSNNIFSLFYYGSMGVEFFFLISGFFLGKKCKDYYDGNRHLNSREDALDDIRFIKNKLLGFLPYFIIDVIICNIGIIILYKNEGLNAIIKNLLNRIPSALLIAKTGLNLGAEYHVTWYLSVLIISSALLYPIIKKNYYKITYTYGPIIALLILGAMYYNTKSISNTAYFDGMVFKVLIRGIGEMLIGASLYNITLYFNKNPRYKKIINIIEIGSITSFLILISLKIGTKYQLIHLLLLICFVGSAFNKNSLFYEKFNKRIFVILGKLSLIIYLGQSLPILLRSLYKWDTPYKNTIYGFIPVYIVSVVLIYIFGELLKKNIIKK